MGLGAQRSASPCFCNAGCPQGTFPWFQYWVEAVAINVPHYFSVIKLYRFDNKSATGDFCTWIPVEPEFPGGTETLTLNPVPAAPGFKAWTATLFIQQLTLSNEWISTNVVALPEDGLVQPEASNSCSRTEIVLDGNVNHPTLGAAKLIPAFQDACDDSDWPAKQKRKLSKPF